MAEVAVGIGAAAVTIIAVVCVVELGIIIYDRIKAKRRKRRMKRLFQQRMELYYTQNTNINVTNSASAQQPPPNTFAQQPVDWFTANMNRQMQEPIPPVNQSSENNNVPKKQTGWIKLKAKLKRSKKKDQKDAVKVAKQKKHKDDEILATGYVPYFENVPFDPRVETIEDVYVLSALPLPALPAQAQFVQPVNNVEQQQPVYAQLQSQQPLMRIPQEQSLYPNLDNPLDEQLRAQIQQQVQQQVQQQLRQIQSPPPQNIKRFYRGDTMPGNYSSFAGSVGDSQNGSENSKYFEEYDDLYSENSFAQNKNVFRAE